MRSDQTVQCSSNVNSYTDTLKVVTDSLDPFTVQCAAVYVHVCNQDDDVTGCRSRVYYSQTIHLEGTMGIRMVKWNGGTEILYTMVFRLYSFTQLRMKSDELNIQMCVICKEIVGSLRADIMVTWLFLPSFHSTIPDKVWYLNL